MPGRREQIRSVEAAGGGGGISMQCGKAIDGAFGFSNEKSEARHRKSASSDASVGDHMRMCEIRAKFWGKSVETMPQRRFGGAYLTNVPSPNAI
ncbi:hypothetical protein EYF80_026855 [Liparis tanakae]|uniref:Uncharacterized protein n=1 Tax=Liparis tanakae TaxID=230148 RepID=A0A4Z2HD05_9TELE|nr:hypothetical protein EYF80_026855 [Liparis tanakae]